MPSTDPSTFKSPSHPPTNTPYPAPDDLKTECVTYEIGNVTHSVSAAVEAGYDPVIQQQTGYHVI